MALTEPHDKSIIAAAMGLNGYNLKERIMIHSTPQLIKVDAFTVMGLSERTKNSNEFNSETARLPGLWQRFYASKISIKPSSPIYGVYSAYEADHNGFYTVTAGIATHDLEITDDFSRVSIKEGDYLIFKNSGPIPKAIIEIWQAIWHYFDTQSTVSRAYETDFEVYMGQEQCAVYIGIKK
ncbi:Transcription activator, effector binding [Legionella steigerwaltii]|uniref:Transcription activator n=1 Tax=Legionella steigerwaltii TaxID=460 RepID=A0A378L8N0_9GAMM|nr:GyrI-like domain-containing protein [Legionella steigerwaltii]KTD77774.1 Transcription activator [Legionella steigerwaltii]STY23084.1 Transcription activator, effector binding [Legionella steigerwaltii]